MLPDRVSNPGPLTYESGALPIALRGPARVFVVRGAVMPTNIVRVYICLTVVCRSLSGVRIMLLFNVHGKHLWSCRDGQLTHTFLGQA